VLRKVIGIGIGLLLISVTLAPSIDFIVVKASDENTLTVVTSEVYGIEGVGETTVPLTKQQYQHLKQYLVDFNARLNQTSSREEIGLMFKEAVVELNRYGLLPRGLSVERAQKAVLGERFNPIVQNFLKKIPSSDVINLLCYFFAHTYFAFEDTIWILIEVLTAFLFYRYDLKIFRFLSSLIFDYSQFKPFRFMNRVWVAGPGIGGITYSYFTLGLLGIRRGSDDFSTAYGFSGIKLILDGEWEAVYLGFTVVAT
jgi:hypothetical protein